MAEWKGYKNLNPTLVMKLELLEKRLKTNGLNPTSGYRSQAENDKLKNASDNSYHLKGMAMDIGRSSFDENPQELYTIAKSIGFGGIGIYNTHVHVDIGPNRFWDKRNGNGPYDTKYVKVNTAKVDLKSIDIAKTVDDVIGSATSTSYQNQNMSSLVGIGILILAVFKIAKNILEN